MVGWWSVGFVGEYLVGSIRCAPFVCRLCVIALLKGPSKVDTFQSAADRWQAGAQFSFAWVDVLKAPGFAAQVAVPLSR